MAHLAHPPKPALVLLKCKFTLMSTLLTSGLVIAIYHSCKACESSEITQTLVYFTQVLL